MGGNLFTGTKRVLSNEYERLEKECIQLLNDIKIRPLSIKYLSSKESHGDCDLIVDNSDLNLDNIKELYENYPVAINGKHVSYDSYFETHLDGTVDKLKEIDILSFVYKGFHIDLISVPTESVFFARQYHSYNDLGGIMGSCLRHMGFHLGKKGIYTKYYPSKKANSKWYPIYLTKDWDEFCNVFEIDKDIYRGGSLKDTDEMFEWLCDFKYFNSDLMNPDMMNATRRNRAAKRKVFNIISELSIAKGGVRNFNPDSKLHDDLVSKFDPAYINYQIEEADKDYEYEVEKKRSLSLERLERVMGRSVTNPNKVFMYISNLFGGPSMAREKAYMMTDSEFLELVNEYYEKKEKE